MSPIFVQQAKEPISMNRSPNGLGDIHTKKLRLKSLVIIKPLRYLMIGGDTN